MLSGVVEGIFPGIRLAGLPKSYVLAYDGKTKWVNVMTNEKGEFQFQDLEPGTYLVIARAPGFSESSMSNVIIGKGEKKLQILLHFGRNDLGSVGQD